MKTFFTSDPHFGHVNMTEAGRDLCGRGFADVKSMNEALLDGINSVVGTDDRLVILGDLVMGNFEENVQLLGRIRARELVLLPGNHDRWSLAYHHKGTDEEKAAKREEFRQKYEAVRPGTLAYMDSAPSAWTWVNLVGQDAEGHNDPLNRVLFSHYPYEGDSHGEDRAAFLRAEDEGMFMVHGHVHGEWRIRGRQFNVGVDVNQFKPVSEDEVREWVTGSETRS